VHRELPFTARFSLRELHALGLVEFCEGEDFVVVQGTADLAVLLPGEIWILDFKTDAVRGSAVRERAERYRPQLALYERSLSRIYQRPVTRCLLHFLEAGETVEMI
jgi:ATP-dependent helicase/nuclease subunit A